MQDSLKHACSVTQRLLSLYNGGACARDAMGEMDCTAQVDWTEAEKSSDRSVQEVLQGIMFAS